MTIKQQKMLENQAQLNGFDFSDNLKIGDKIIKLEEIEAFDIKTQNTIIDNIMKKNYQVVLSEEQKLEIENAKKKHKEYINNYLHNARIEEYQFWIKYHEENPTIESQQQIKKWKKLLKKEMETK